MIFLDNREPAKVRELVAGGVSCPTQVLRLDAGDYLMLDKDSCSLAIERKTWADLLSSITDGRLFAQLDRMQEQYHYTVLMIEGMLKVTEAWSSHGAPMGKVVIGNKPSSYTHGFVQMTLFSLQRESNVSVLHTPSLAWSVDLIKAIYERGQKGCYGISTRKKRKVTLDAKIRVAQGR